MTGRTELDAVDRKILRILGTDGRASYQAIADEVGLSRPAVMERVKRLEESRHISTYLAIKVGVGELPPFLFAGLRFLVAGLLLLAVALALGDKLPRQRSDWRTQAIVGVLLLAGGNAFVVWAEQYTSSGTASIFVVTVALWMAFFDAVIPGGSGELGWRVIAGLVLGFLGTGLLVGANPAEILRADLRGPVALTCASASS